MPELPEVETVRQGLIPVVNNKQITRVEKRRSNLRWPLPLDMAERLVTFKIQNIARRSKYILFNLSSDETLLVHLGMSGRLLVYKNQVKSHEFSGSFKFNTCKTDKHDHVIIHLDSDIRVVYNDPRRFGAMDITPTKQLNMHKWLKNLGPEPLSNEFSSDYLYEKLKKRKSSVKAALMDQTLVAGLGNIYVLEALWLSGISPLRLSLSLEISEVESLAASIISVLNSAISAGGTSLQDFRHVGGEIGYFQQSLNVYGCFNEKCRNIDCLGTIKRLKQSGRTSYYCDRCQK